MSSRAMLVGTTGGVMGTFTGITGVMWSLLSISFMIDYSNYTMLPTLSLWLGVSALGAYNYPHTAFLFLVFSLVLASFLIVSCILLGVGFYGIYEDGGEAGGLLGLFFGIGGGITSSLLIILTNVITSTSVIVILLTPIYPIYTGFIGVLPIFASTPNIILLWAGMIILALTFIVLGSSSIAVRYTTNAPKASTAAGILSIVGACCLVLYILVQPNAPGLAVLGGLFSFVGFVLIFVAFILWAVVFNKSRKK